MIDISYLKDTTHWKRLHSTVFFDTEFVGIKKNFSKLTKAQKEATAHQWRSDKFLGFKEMEAEKKTTPAKYWQTNAGLTHFTKVICISVGYFNDGEFRKSSFIAADDYDGVNMLKDFEKFIQNRQFKSLCAHHLDADVRAITKECIRLGQLMPLKIRLMLNLTPWQYNDIGGIAFCTNRLASKFYGRFVRLSDLCAILGVPTSKDDIDGSQVHKEFYKGNIDRILTYCEKDVEATAAVFVKMLPYL